tara:strand:- start:5283 stop:6179 length:897 start_codon:yes stop_codon:yes gene_type:complete
MIIDVHTHIPTHRENVPENEERIDHVMRPDGPVRLNNSFDDYIRDMGPVDVSCVFGVAINPHGSEGDMGVMTDQNTLNDISHNLAKKDPLKIIGFMSIHPDSDNLMYEMDRCTKELGLKGLKLAPNYQGFDPLGDNAKKVYKYCEKNNVPIIFHQGTAPMRTAPLMYAHPMVMDELAMEFQNLKIVMAHMAHPWHEDCITVIRKHPNVYADVSGQFYRPWQMYNGMRLALEWDVMSKLLFASDWPLTTPQETIDHLIGLTGYAERYNLPEIPQEPLKSIINRDSLSILGLVHPKQDKI